MATTTSGGTIVMVGTRKGLWIGRSDEAREEWEFTGPHFDMEEVYSCMVDTRGDTPRLLVGASSSWLGPQVWRSDDLGASWQETPNGAIRFPEGSEETLARVWQLVPGPEDGVVYAGTEPGAVWKSTDRGETLRPRAGPVGPPRAAGVGRGLRRPGLPHDPAAPHRPAVGDGRDLHGRRLPDHRRRRVLAGAQPGHQGGVPAGGRAVPRLRPVRAQGHPAPVAARAALPPEPRRRLPLRRRGRSLEVHRRRPARRVRLPDRRAPPRARHGVRLPAQRRCRPLPTRRQGPGLALPRRGGDLGGARATGCPRPSTSA